jgi:hypothetical protein
LPTINASIRRCLNVHLEVEGIRVKAMSVLDQDFDEVFGDLFQGVFREDSIRQGGQQGNW